MEDRVMHPDDGMEMIDTSQNNPGELTLALRKINALMETKGWTYERAALKAGIPGHPYFEEFWPVKKWWGDVRWARERLGLPIDD